MDWSDVRLFLAVSRCSTLAKAAEQLQTSHSTVSRRLASLETRANLKLFAKTAAGHTLTAAGQAIYEAALSMEEGFLAVTRQISAQDAPGEQPIRVSAPDVLINHLVPSVETFHKREPSVLLQLDVDNTAINLARLEAEVVLRATRVPQPYLVGTRVGQTAWAVYAHRDLRKYTLDDRRLAWIGYGGVLAELPVAQWMRENIPKQRVTLRTNSSVAAQTYARTGLGAACLWCLAGDSDQDLVRLSPPLPDVASDLWLLTHPDLRQSRRIAKARAFLAQTLRSDRALLEGKKPGH